MGFTIPGMELFSKPNQEKVQAKTWDISNKQMADFKLPNGMSWNYNTHMKPFYNQAQGDISNAYSGALSGLQGSQAFQNLMQGSGLNTQAMQFALGQQRRGAGLQEEELSRIAALDRGGWDPSNAASLAEIAPEVNAAGSAFSDQIAAMEAAGVRGGALDAAKYAASRDAGTATGNALQEAIRRNRETKMGIAGMKFGAQNLTMNDPQSIAAMQALSQLYGAGAGDMSGLASGMFGRASDAGIGNLDRSSDLFKYLQQQSWGKAQQDADRSQGARNQAMSSAGQVMSGAKFSDSRLKTPPGEVRGVLSELKKLPVYDYRYNEKAEDVGVPSGTPGRGVMAQDLEKIPSMKHLVHRDPETGYRKVDVYGLTATALRAVQELDKKLTNIARSKAPKTLSRMRFAPAGA
jgi:Chaperone of endosialidase